MGSSPQVDPRQPSHHRLSQNPKLVLRTQKPKTGPQNPLRFPPPEAKAAGEEAPRNAQGQMLCWGLSTHRGCKRDPCQHAHTEITSLGGLAWQTISALLVRGGLSNGPQVTPSDAQVRIQQLQKQAAAAHQANVAEGSKGKSGKAPADLVWFDPTAQEKELHEYRLGPDHSWLDRPPLATTILKLKVSNHPTAVDRSTRLAALDTQGAFSLVEGTSDHLQCHVRAKVSI